MEQIFAINPFTLVELSKELRSGDWGSAYALLERSAENWLRRHNILEEALGTEPLAMLIRAHVLDAIGGSQTTTIGDFQRATGTKLLITTTNLHAGRLEVWGPPHDERLMRVGRRADAFLLEALLAGSAFPGVFRPRWSWELLPTSNREEQYADGGIIDNLPLEPLTRYLNWLAKERDIPYWPKVPHLILTASLESDPGEVPNWADYHGSGTWLNYGRRAKQLQHNRKIDQFAVAQENFQSLRGDRSWQRDYLKLKVVAVKPKWTVNSFAFHRLLGYRRQDQARSIAHGCAMTMEALLDAQQEHRDGWGVQKKLAVRDKPLQRSDPAGLCHYVNDKICPFSKECLKKLGIEPTDAQALSQIYAQCRRHDEDPAGHR